MEDGEHPHFTSVGVVLSRSALQLIPFKQTDKNPCQKPVFR